MASYVVFVSSAQSGDLQLSLGCGKDRWVYVHCTQSILNVAVLYRKRNALLRYFPKIS